MLYLVKIKPCRLDIVLCLRILRRLYNKVHLNLFIVIFDRQNFLQKTLSLILQNLQRAITSLQWSSGCLRFAMTGASGRVLQLKGVLLRF